MTGTQGELACRLAAPIIAARAKADRPVIIGLCGPQGSGKSTLAGGLKLGLAEAGLSCAVLSIDDVYLTREARRRLAVEVHPLLAVRGPPGTHDVTLANDVLDHMLAGRPVRLPAFDKARDDRAADGELVAGPTDIILFEGWCVGARPQAGSDLDAPVNALERDEDSHGVWRGYVNAALEGAYQSLFARLDLHLLLQPPSFDVVAGWRREQEQALRARSGMGMSDAEVDRFVQYYERLSRHIAREAPERADVIVQLDADRRPVRIDRA